MDPQQQNTQNLGGVPPSIPPPEKNQIGPAVAVIIIVLILAAGGFYFWKTQMAQRSMTPEDILGAEDPVLEELQAQGASDEIADIETDLNATVLGGLDAELSNIERELGF